MYTASSERYDTMVYNRCGKSGLLLPAVSLGLWHNFGTNADPENMKAMLRTAFDLGITHFDLANNYGPEYGSAETNFGKILKEDFAPYRDEMIISTKAGYDMWPGPYGNWGSRKYLIASLDQSLKRMGLDYVDIFYHHRMDPNTPLEETMGALDSIVKSGKALYVGISNYDGPTIPSDSRIAVDGRFLHADALTKEKLAQIEALNKMAGERGQSLAQMALSWILKDEDVTSVLIGASRPEQIIQNVEIVQNTKFTREELKKIDQISRGDL